MDALNVLATCILDSRSAVANNNIRSTGAGMLLGDGLATNIYTSGQCVLHVKLGISWDAYVR